MTTSMKAKTTVMKRYFEYTMAGVALNRKCGGVR